MNRTLFLHTLELLKKQQLDNNITQLLDIIEQSFNIHYKNEIDTQSQDQQDVIQRTQISLQIFKLSLTIDFQELQQVLCAMQLNSNLIFMIAEYIGLLFDYKIIDNVFTKIYMLFITLLKTQQQNFSIKSIYNRYFCIFSKFINNVTCMKEIKNYQQYIIEQIQQLNLINNISENDIVILINQLFSYKDVLLCEFLVQMIKYCTDNKQFTQISCLNILLTHNDQIIGKMTVTDYDTILQKLEVEQVIKIIDSLLQSLVNCDKQKQTGYLIEKSFATAQYKVSLLSHSDVSIDLNTILINNENVETNINDLSPLQLYQQKLLSQIDEQIEKFKFIRKLCDEGLSYMV